MKTITFYSYKGGVGRTLALSNIATRLAELGRKVFLIDFDFEAPGLPFKFKTFNRNSIQRGLVDYIHEYSIKHEVPSSIKPYTYTVNLGKGIRDIYLLPAGNTMLKDYWSRLAMLNWHDLFYKTDSQGLELFIDLKNKIEQEYEPDFLLVDSRTGITEISGITISIFADDVVLFFANNNESLDGTARVVNAITSHENDLIKGQPRINLVLSRIPYRIGNDESYVDANLKSKALSTINNVLKSKGNKNLFKDIHIIHSDRELEVLEKFKIGFSLKLVEKDLPSIESSDFGAESASISQDYLSLFESLTKGQLSDGEIERFNRMKASQHYVVLAERPELPEAKKIEFLKDAVRLDEKNFEAHRQLAMVYLELRRFDEAEGHVNCMLDLDPKSVNAIFLKAYLHYNRNEYDDALDKFTELYKTFLLFSAANGIIQIHTLRGNLQKAYEVAREYCEVVPESWESLNALANVLRLLGRTDEALAYAYKAISHGPRNPFPYSTLAEINAVKGNDEEFYKNLEIALIFGLPFDEISSVEEIYTRYISEPRFVEMVKKYGFDLESLGAGKEKIQR